MTGEVATVEDTDFEDAFEEFSSAKDSSSEQLASPADQDEEASTHNPEDDEAVASKSGSDEDPSKKREADSSGDDEFISSLPESAQARFKQLMDEKADLQHKFNSNTGRVTAFQKKVQTLQDEINEIRSGPTSGGQPSQQQIVDAMKGTPEDWNQFTQDYPEIATVIDNRFELMAQATQTAVDSTLAPVRAYQQATAQREADTALAESEQAVAEVFPTWTEEVKTPDFKAWLESQSPGVASLADSDDTEDAKTLIGLYDAHLVTSGKSSIKKQSPTEPGADNEKPGEQNNRRQQQLQAGANVRTKNVGIDTTDAPLDEYEAAFNHFASQKDKSRVAARN